MHSGRSQELQLLVRGCTPVAPARPQVNFDALKTPRVASDLVGSVLASLELACDDPLGLLRLRSVLYFIIPFQESERKESEGVCPATPRRQRRVTLCATPLPARSWQYPRVRARKLIGASKISTISTQS